MKKIIPIAVISLLSATFSSVVLATDVDDKQQELRQKQLEVKETQKELVHESKKEHVEHEKVTNEAMQQISRVTKIIGTTVKSTGNEKLGDIKDLVLNPETGHVVYAVVSFGGVLGVGNKLFAVPWKALTWTRDKEYYVIGLDKETLKKAPGFDKKHWPDSASKWDMQREELEQFYRITP